MLPGWPADAEALMAVQAELAAAAPPVWRPAAGSPRLGGCWVCFPRGLVGPGGPGDLAWAASVVVDGARVIARHVDRDAAAAPYRPGLLALRLGAVMERAVTAPAVRPDVLLLDATARDHPRRAGLALHLGAVLGLPTVGVTHRPLVGRGPLPSDRPGATSPLTVEGDVVACWLRTRPGTRPLVVHPGWRVDLDTAVAVIEQAVRGRRTPEPLRLARQLAREARAAA